MALLKVYWQKSEHIMGLGGKLLNLTEVDVRIHFAQ